MTRGGPPAAALGAAGVGEAEATGAEISHARAQDIATRAAQLQLELGRVPNARERIWFCLDAFEDDVWVRGKSAGVAASVWKLHPNTVERSASLAALMLEEPGEVERARVAVTTRALRRSDEIYERAAGASPKVAGSLYQAANGALDTFGKATGAIAAGPSLSVLVDQRTGAPRPEVQRQIDMAHSEALDVARRAVAACGWDVARWEAALARVAQQPALEAAGGTGADGGDR